MGCLHIVINHLKIIGHHVSISHPPVEPPRVQNTELEYTMIKTNPDLSTRHLHNKCKEYCNAAITQKQNGAIYISIYT